MTAAAPSYRGYKPSSPRASRTLARSRSTDSVCERQLRSALRKLGLWFRKNDPSLPGRPDILFRRAKVVVFCDGDFWHGRDGRSRKRRLARGANSSYWLAKIKANINRDRRQSAKLMALGWKVVRLWETDILLNPLSAARRVARLVRTRQRR